ncbi:MAG: type II toxin-antitoxin system PemK/MazF family toxin [Candidatus ainarchaeum sp.]|nr:type II toxin-antitoxin system PemK/MazF family toxin [Candidatus ainarchaeum sp.]
MYSPKEIVLVSCPYTDDFSISKLRPLLVLSKDEHNTKEKRLFGLVITSSANMANPKSENTFEIKQSFLKMNKLQKQSFVLADMPYATFENQVKYKIDVISQEFFDKIVDKFIENIGE